MVVLKYLFCFKTLSCKNSITISFANLLEKMFSVLKLLQAVHQEIHARLKAILKCSCFDLSIRRSINNVEKF